MSRPAGEIFAADSLRSRWTWPEATLIIDRGDDVAFSTLHLMTSPRVLQVVLTLSPGGTERLVIEIIKRSLPDIPMAVCCLDELGAWGQQLQSEGIDVRALTRRPGFHPALGRSLASVAAAHGATVIHAHQYSPFVYSALARCWRPGLRVLFTEHGRLSDAPPSAKRRLANRLLSLLPREVYAVSDELRRHIAAEGFASAGVIYNGIDVGPAPSEHARHLMRRALGIDDETFVIGTVARLDPVKDLGTLVRAVAALNHDRKALLLVVGDGSERAPLEQLAATCDGGASTRFLGHRDDARSVLAACDAFGNSSVSEGVSLTILEAMAARLPVVATHVGGTPEVVDQTCGRLVPARDHSAVATALREFAVDPALRVALGDAGRRRVEVRFTLARMVREYADAYHRVAAA